MYGGGGMSAPGAGAGAGSGGKPWHTGMGIMCFWMLMWITGVVLLPIGISSKSFLDGFDPSTDFSAVQGGCKIYSVMHVADQRQDRNPFCVDVYTYTFTAGSSSTIYTSAPEEIQHDKGTQCNEVAQLPASYVAGEVLATCWKPASGKTKSDVDSFYGCGNPQCIKVLNPAIEHERALGSANLFLTLAVLFLSLGLVGCGVTGILTYKCKTAEQQFSDSAA